MEVLAVVFMVDLVGVELDMIIIIVMDMAVVVVVVTLEVPEGMIQVTQQVVVVLSPYPH